jgi:RNA polymerase sigma-70 factor (ECF subfamily)
VNSALHRARATLTKHYHHEGLDEVKLSPTDERTRALLDRYVRAWESADVAGLVALLIEDARLSMPPSPSWYQGRAAIGAFLATVVFTGEAWRQPKLFAVTWEFRTISFMDA